MLSSTTTTVNPYIESSPSFIYDHHQPNHHHQLPISYPLSYNGDHHYGYASSSAGKRRKKKDRHSKIYTAQGLRDRRVRLSIEISRKFFDLQDMLGFDKASKTLDWLLTKSKKAIKELAKINYNGNINKSLCSNSSEEVVSEPEEGNLVSKNQKITTKLKKKAAALSSSSTLNPVAAKELREKARARARERTRVKLLGSTTATLNNSKINLDPTFQILNQLRSSGSSSSGCYSSNHILPSPSSSFSVVAAHHQAEDQPNNHHNIIEESIVIKRKLMGTYQPNLLMLKDANCNNYNNNFPNLVPNWDINSALARSSLCAIANMNRSTGLQLYGKLWEAENSECLH